MTTYTERHGETYALEVYQPYPDDLWYVQICRLESERFSGTLIWCEGYDTEDQAELRIDQSIDLAEFHALIDLFDGTVPAIDDADEPMKCRHCGRVNIPRGVCDECYCRYYDQDVA